MKFGVHVSIAGKIHKAIDRGQTLGCDTIQIFSSNPRQWRSFEYPKEDIVMFNKKRRRSKIDPLFLHTIYLVNLASPDEKIYQDSIHSLIDSLKVAFQLKALGVVTHLGSHLGVGLKEGIARISAALDFALYQTKSRVPIILENSSGGGNTVGGDLEEIAKIIEGVGKKEKILVCIDTAHTFEYGYDIIEKLDEFLKKIDRTIGISKIALLHLNDSKTPSGSHNDIHENIGEGHIGIEAFKRIINHPKLKNLPGILETPHFKNKEKDRNNLDKIKKLVE